MARMETNEYLRRCGTKRHGRNTASSIVAVPNNKNTKLRKGGNTNNEKNPTKTGAVRTKGFYGSSENK